MFSESRLALGPNPEKLRQRTVLMKMRRKFQVALPKW